MALARALARGAKLLLLDEPFSALDESLRSDLRRELVRLRAEMGLSILFVTHDLREAHLLADRIAVFDDGRVLQVDTRDAVFRRPANRRVGRLCVTDRGAALGAFIRSWRQTRAGRKATSAARVLKHRGALQRGVGKTIGLVH